jgi:hypothetical protein
MAETEGKSKKLILFGLEDFADIAFEYFTHDSDYEVVGFTVDRKFLSLDCKFGLPVVAFEDVTDIFPPQECELFAAVVYALLTGLGKKYAIGLLKRDIDLLAT